MSYTITGKNGVTPKFMQGEQSLAEIMGTVNMFIAFNQNSQRDTKAMDDQAKIAYYNEKSFYIVSEVK